MEKKNGTNPLYNQVQLYCCHKALFNAAVDDAVRLDVERPFKLAARDRLTAMSIALYHMSASIADIARNYGYDLYARSKDEAVCSPWTAVGDPADAGCPVLYRFDRVRRAVMTAEIAIKQPREHFLTWPRGAINNIWEAMNAAKIAVDTLADAIGANEPDGIWIIREKPGQERFLISPYGKDPIHTIYSPGCAAAYLIKSHAESVRNRMAAYLESDDLSVEPLAGAMGCQSIHENPWIWLLGQNGITSTSPDAQRYDGAAAYRQLANLRN